MSRPAHGPPAARHRHPWHRPAARLLGLLLLASPASAAPPALTPPPEPVVAEAKRLVAAMTQAERGPYARLRWYCKDGTTHPPSPYACAERGGGRQHAEYSPERQRLAELGWHVGTVVAALDWDELWDGARRHQRLRELPLERYLTDVDDGWVLRRARYYRGRIQVEDEEAAGRALLERLLADPQWLQRNYLLAREAVRTVPHNGGSDRTRTVRRLSQEIAEKDASFEHTRIKIHTAPGPEDLRATREWVEAARRRDAEPALVTAAETLIGELEALYGRGREWLAEARRVLGRQERWAEFEGLVAERPGEPGGARLERLSRALGLVREIVSTTAGGTANLAWLDASLGLELEVSIAAFDTLGKEALSRRDHLTVASALLDGTWGAGLHSLRERDALRQPLERILAGPGATSGYVAAAQNLRRAAPWAVATVRYTFAEALALYTAIEPEAARFVDDLVRGSALLPLAEAVTRLVADSDALSGVTHRIFRGAYGGIVGLNPGVARGRLRIAGAADLEARGSLSRDEIVVLPETVSDLEPVAGILTLAEGNLLSHVQLLARNLGIPNAALSPALARELEAHRGRDVVLIVGTDGSVVLEDWETLPAAARERLDERQRTGSDLEDRLDAPVPDLTARRPLRLDEMRAELAGRVVGPKAANLGELAYQFPGRVAAAVALPFGIFADHVQGGPDAPKSRLDRAFERHREGAISEQALAAEVEAVRQAVTGLSLSEALRNELTAELQAMFGQPGSYGVFVRSDTNVEDLPGFTGAGLNQTLPNVVGLDRLFAGIPQVWSSPYTERAMAWRSTILKQPEDVYASVLLMKSVPADKSGVMVTTDLAARAAGLTVATAWGVGGAVDGEAAETVVLRPDGSTFLVGEAKAPYRRRLEPAGGVGWAPAEAGQVLSAEERNALRRLAVEVGERLEPALSPEGETLPWDIEFGFVGGELTLFQIRPLVERGQQLADRLVTLTAPAPARRPTAARTDLDQALETK